jgi:hypothetical protein
MFLYHVHFFTVDIMSCLWTFPWEYWKGILCYYKKKFHFLWYSILIKDVLFFYRSTITVKLFMHTNILMIEQGESFYRSDKNEIKHCLIFLKLYSFTVILSKNTSQYFFLGTFGVHMAPWSTVILVFFEI